MLDATRQRILRATSASLSWQGLDSVGAAGDPGVVTVGVTTSDGTTVIAAGTATSGTTTAERTVPLTVAQTASLDVLTATWKVGATTVATTRHDIVGGYYCTVAELRAQEPSTADTSRDADTTVLRARAEIEAMFESACNMAFVPRFDVTRRHRVTGCRVPLRRPYLRSVRWARIWWAPGSYTSLTSTEIANIPASDTGVVELPYRVGGCDVELGYEHGLDAPPFDVKREALVAIRANVNKARAAGVLDRATSMQMGDGTSVTLATPGVGRWHTGIPSVDEVLRRYDHTDWIR